MEKYKLKIAPDNTITIKAIQKSDIYKKKYSEDEVVRLMAMFKLTDKKIIISNIEDARAYLKKEQNYVFSMSKIEEDMLK